MDTAHTDSGNLITTPASRYRRWLGALVTIVLMSACGGGSSGDTAGSGAVAGGGDGGSGSGGGGGAGGGSGGVATVATLEVTPASATVPIGGTAQYSVVARDSTGLVIATPPVVWASGTPAVGSITAAGLATGQSLGQTAITATAGGLVSSQTVLNVVDGACEGVAAVAGWQVNFWYEYQDSTTTPDGVDVDALHYSSVASPLSAAGRVGDKLAWSGSLVSGPGAIWNGNPRFADHTAILENLSDLVSDPTNVIKVEGTGPPIPTPGVDGFMLKVDLSTCTFQFIAAPSIHATITRTVHAVSTLPGPDEGTHVFDQDISLGLVQKGITPLGAWRTLGMGGFPDQFGFTVSYSIGFFPDGVDGYMPSGLFPQGAFFYPPSAAPRGGGPRFGDGSVSYSYKIVPVF